MTTFTRGSYKITSTATQSYLNAITLFNQNLPITIKMRDGKSFLTKCERYCKNLPAIILELREEGIAEFSLEYTTYNGLSMHKVFPSLTFPADFSKKSSFVIKDICEWFKRCLVAMRRTDDVYIVIDKPLFSGSLDKESAISIIANMQGVAAVDLPALQTIVFQFEAVCAYITHGDAPNFGILEHVELDIDDGFTDRGLCENALEIRMIEELQRLFTPWKENNYQGSPIPSSAGLVVPSNAQTALTNRVVMQQGDSVSCKPSENYLTTQQARLFSISDESSAPSAAEDRRSDFSSRKRSRSPI